MTTKLKNLTVKKVDFVDEGANPEAHIKIVKRNVAEEKKQETEENELGIWKRLASFIGKALGMKQEEIVGTMEEVEKEEGSSSLEKVKTNHEEEKGEKREMKIDKSKMTPAERAMLEEFEKKYGSDSVKEETVQTERKEESKDSFIGQEVEKNKENKQDEDIYKGLNPELVNEIKSLKKYKADKEEQELNEIAKRYEIIGRKPEELVPLFKSLKINGGYEEMVAILDETVAVLENAGTFDEIGKRGTDLGSGTEAIAKLKTKASELRKTRPELTEAQAMDEVLLSDDELRAELDV